MNNAKSTLHPSVLKHLSCMPRDRAVVVLLRHSVRDHLPPGEVGYRLPITKFGRDLAVELGEHLKGKLRTLRTSPFVRCIQTAEALAEGACADLDVVPDCYLGDPGVFVIDGRRAWKNREDIGHEGVMRHLVTETTALSGMARPDEAARILVQHMFAIANNRPGIHVFVTHDSLVTATAARFLGRPLSVDDWPGYLEGAFFWRDDIGVNAAYRGHKARRVAPLCTLDVSDVIEFARREIAATVGLDTGARFFLAGGAFKSLLTGIPPRDLDLWAPSEHDRGVLIDALCARGARSSNPRPFADTFELDGRLIEVPHNVEHTTLFERLSQFDIGLSAVGVEHRPEGRWSSVIHPLAIESARRRQVLLLKPLVNWKYALVTLERMRRYGHELGYCVPPKEEAEVWRVFEAQSDEMRSGMLERYRRCAAGDAGVIEEYACRFS